MIEGISSKDVTRSEIAWLLLEVTAVLAGMQAQINIMCQSGSREEREKMFAVTNTRFDDLATKLKSFAEGQA